LAEQQKLGREVMNSSPSPQTNWKFILITVGGFVLLAFLFLKMFWFPWQQSQRALTLLEDDYDRQQRSYLTFMKERKKLTAFRLLGLPKNLEKGGSDYAHYLQDLLQECGFTVEDVQGPVGLEARNQAPARGKKVSHIPLTFLVRAQGDWGALVKLLERFQRTPLLHRLKSWSVDQDPSAKDKNGKKLVVNLTVEALVVNHNDKRPDNLWGIDPRLVAADALLAMQGRPTGWAMLLRGQALLLPPMPERRYGDVVRVNPFVGGRLPEEKEKKRDTRPPDNRSNVYLALTDHAGQKAILLAASKYKGESAIKLTTTAGHNEFEVWDGKGLLKARVLRVDPRDVYVQVGKAIYAFHVGQNLAEAMERPLAPGELARLGLGSHAAP
jgi:hypothetical protein